MPSDTVMVLKSTLLPPAASTPAAASRASSAMCMLQGVRLAQVEAMPTCGLAKSASVKSDGAQHAARRGLLETIDHQPRVAARIGALGLRLHVPVSTMRRSRNVMMKTPTSVQAPPNRIRADSWSPSSSTLSRMEKIGDKVVSGATLVIGYLRMR